MGVGGSDELRGDFGLEFGSLKFGNPRDRVRGLFIKEGGTGLAGETILSLGNVSLKGGGGLGGTSLNNN